MKLKNLTIIFVIFYILSISLPFVDRISNIFEKSTFSMVLLYISFIVSSILFASFLTKLKLIAMEKFTQKDTNWKYYFYGSYILLVILGWPLINSFVYGMIICAPLFIVTFLIGDVIIVTKVFKEKINKTFLYNLIVPTLAFITLAFFLIIAIRGLE